ncbi:MAG: hypothetical protein ABIQ98_01335 [Sphingomicrobium sp.]
MVRNELNSMFAVTLLELFNALEVAIDFAASPRLTELANRARGAPYRP